MLDFFHGWAPQVLINAISSISFLTHFDSITKGVIDIRDLIYYAVLIAYWLYACVVVIDMKKGS